jgi:uncharacterized protein YutE (UPF0331/DUF86 family)
LRRIREEYAGREDLFGTNYTIQDSIILNLQRACEASIDLANYIVKKEKLGIPLQSRDAFDLLFKAGLLSRELAEKMMKMIGFRNLAVHSYQELNLKIVRSIIENNLDDFKEFTSTILKA